MFRVCGTRELAVNETMWLDDLRGSSSGYDVPDTIVLCFGSTFSSRLVVELKEAPFAVALMMLLVGGEYMSGLFQRGLLGDCGYEGDR